MGSSMTGNGSAAFQQRLARIEARQAAAATAVHAEPSQAGRRGKVSAGTVASGAMAVTGVSQWGLMALTPLLGAGAWIGGNAIAFHAVSAEGRHTVPALQGLEGFADFSLAIVLLCVILLRFGLQPGTRQKLILLGFVLAMGAETTLAGLMPQLWGRIYTPERAEAMVLNPELPEGFVQSIVGPVRVSPPGPPKVEAVRAAPVIKLSDLSDG